MCIRDSVRAVSENSRLDAHRGDEARMTACEVDVLHCADGFGESTRQVAVGRGELVGELVISPLECRIALGDQHALVGVANALDVDAQPEAVEPVSYTHLRAHETRHDLVCRLL